MDPFLDRLRRAIISDVAEDAEAIGELGEWHAELVAAWNAVPGVVPIADKDIEF